MLHFRASIVFWRLHLCGQVLQMCLMRLRNSLKRLRICSFDNFILFLPQKILCYANAGQQGSRQEKAQKGVSPFACFACYVGLAPDPLSVKACRGSVAWLSPFVASMIVQCCPCFGLVAQAIGFSLCPFAAAPCAIFHWGPGGVSFRHV